MQTVDHLISDRCKWVKITRFFIILKTSLVVAGVKLCSVFFQKVVVQGNHSHYH